MTQSRGRSKPTAAFLLCAALFMGLPGFSCPAEGSFVPTFREVPCPFEIPRDGSLRYGVLTVPERGTAVNGRTVSVSVLILKSRSKNPRPDPVLYLEGGPGGPSIAYYEDWLASPLLDHRDFILFDQRGVGYSSPDMDCPEIRSARLFSLAPGQDPAKARKMMLDAAKSCAARLRQSGIDLAAYNTAESARDLVALRQALGIRQWNLYGISYGTRLALRLMREDPGGTRSVVLDSVVDPAADEYALAPGNARRAFDAFFEAVSADPAARKAFPDLSVKLRNAVAALDRNPGTGRVHLPDGGRPVEIQVGGSDLLDAIYGFLYDPDSIPYLPILVETVAKGDVSHLVLLQEEYLYDDLSDGLYYALQGHDEAPFSRALPGDPGIYDPLRMEREMALAFESGRADDAANAPLSSDIPTLLLAGGFDPVTPPEGGRRVGKSLSRSAFMLFRGLGHAVTQSLGPERIAADFIEDPSRVPARGSLPEDLVRPFATKLWVTTAPYRLYTRLVYDRDAGTFLAILFFSAVFLLGALSIFPAWRDKSRQAVSSMALLSRFAGGAGAVLDGVFMAALALTVMYVNRSEPAMLFFGLPPQTALFLWLPRFALPAAVLMLAGTPALFRDPEVSRGARAFHLVLLLALVLFALLLSSRGMA